MNRRRTNNQRLVTSAEETEEMQHTHASENEHFPVVMDWSLLTENCLNLRRKH